MYSSRKLPEPQAVWRWTPPAGVLGRIVAEAGERAAALRSDLVRLGELERAAANAAPPPSFMSALRRNDVAIVAEVKRRSPSRGEISSSLDAGAQALAYAAGGAAAVSVLTEPRHFSGSLDDLRGAECARLPLLRKDFIVDEAQIVEARAFGAAAALLIARALAPRVMPELVRAAQALGMDALVEVRDADELERALASGTGVIGVNARDLETLEVFPEVVERLLPRVPGRCVAIAESGVQSAADVRWAGAIGADAVLVGSLLSAAPDPAAAVRALTGVARTTRDG